MVVKHEIRTYDPEQDGDPKQFGGRMYVGPVPIDPAATRFFECGPVRLGVEYRYHSDNEEGIAVHVLDARTNVEMLRFDCFEERAHYHYIHVEAGYHDRFFVDVDADGDPVAWMLDRLRTRLIPMLIRSGAEARVVEELFPADIEAAMARVSVAVYRAVADAVDKRAEVPGQPQDDM